MHWAEMTLFELDHFDTQSTGQKSHCANTFCGHRNALGRNHIAPTLSQAIAMLGLHQTVGFPLSAPVLTWYMGAFGYPRRVIVTPAVYPGLFELHFDIQCANTL